MKAKRIIDVQELLKTEGFQTWYQGHSDALKTMTQKHEEADELEIEISMARYHAEHLQELADENLFKSGDYIDQSAAAQAHFAEIENDSFQLLSDFEQQRQRVSDALVAAHQIENVMETKRSQASERRAELKASNSSSIDSDSVLKTLNVAIESLAGDAAAARKALEKVEGSRDELWVKVEGAWVDSFRANMARSQYAYQGRLVQGKAEKLLARAAKERANLKALDERYRLARDADQNARRKLDEILQQAKDLFDCTVVDEFLFWPREDDVNSTLCVPLIDDNFYFNIQVRACRIYQLEREKGLDFVEPVPEEPSTEEDPRLNKFFLEGRAA